MKVEVNGTMRVVRAATLGDMLEELGFGGARIATAVNGDFVAASARAARPLSEGDRIEVLAPMQGG